MSKLKFGLGKGLDALIPSMPEGEPKPVSVTPSPETRDDGSSTGVLAHIEVARITPNPFQPRTEFHPDSLKELAQSIIENGLVQPVTVRRLGGGFQLISGERRVRACQEAGIRFIPAYIRDVKTDEEMLELALIENIQRETLNPIEIANSYQRLIDDYRYTQEQIAQKVSKNRTTVANMVRLLKLPRDIQESIRKDEISMGHARALINIPDAGTQLRLWKKTVREGLSVRKVEDLARDASKPINQQMQKKARLAAHDNELDSLASKLRAVYGTKVHVAATKKGSGSISFEFYNHDDLERLLELLLDMPRE
jgi:ParB family transcriptional regulator, chromosome partitioning protein